MCTAHRLQQNPLPAVRWEHSAGVGARRSKRELENPTWFEPQIPLQEQGRTVRPQRRQRAEAFGAAKQKLCMGEQDQNVQYQDQNVSYDGLVTEVVSFGATF